MTIIAFKPWRDCWFEYDGLLDWLTQRPGVTDVCEVGAGAKPVLAPALIAGRGLAHTILDASRTELEKAPDGYRKVHDDIVRPGFRFPSRVDLVTSSFLAEHVRRPEVFHRNVWAMLRPGGYALHLFPTLYALPFVINRIAPAALSEKVLRLLQGFRTPEGAEAKFEAYYRWCRGPTGRQRARLQSLGYEIVAYTGYHGHGYYIRLRPLDAAEQAKAALLGRGRVATLTSYALVLLRRPDGTPAPDPPARPRSTAVISANTMRHIESGWR